MIKNFVVLFVGIMLISGCRNFGIDPRLPVPSSWDGVYIYDPTVSESSLNGTEYHIGNGNMKNENGKCFFGKDMDYNKGDTFSVSDTDCYYFSDGWSNYMIHYQRGTDATGDYISYRGMTHYGTYRKQ